MHKSQDAMRKTTDTENETLQNMRPLPAHGEPGITSTSPPMSTPCSQPLPDSIGSWRQPVDVRGLASQVNRVATMVLNGKLSIEDVKGYATLTRTIAQLISAETARARMLREPPNLTFDEDAPND